MKKLNKIKTLTRQLKVINSMSVPSPRTEKWLLEQLHDLLLEVSVQIVEEHRLLYLEDRNHFEESKKIFSKQIRPYLEAAEFTVKTHYTLIHFTRPEWDDLSELACAKGLFLHSLCNWFN